MIPILSVPNLSTKRDERRNLKSRKINHFIGNTIKTQKVYINNKLLIKWIIALFFLNYPLSIKNPFSSLENLFMSNKTNKNPGSTVNMRNALLL